MVSIKESKLPKSDIRTVKEYNVAVLQDLGIFQRPLSAHGVRNQQDSTFSLTGDLAPNILVSSALLNINYSVS